MADFVLKSLAFRRERERSWRALESLLTRVEKSGFGALSTEELMQLPVLYRAALSSLSVARNISLDRNVTTYLEALAGRAYFVVYGGRSRLGGTLRDFFRNRFPRAVRAARWSVLVALLFFVVGIVSGYSLVTSDPDWFLSLVSADMAGGRTPEATTESLRQTLFDRPGSFTENMSAFAAFLFSHNARIGFLAFALGVAFGIPTLLLLLHNGLTVGAMVALFAGRGLGIEFGGWLLVHGATEILAIVLCGAAGLVLGAAVAFPGQQSRLANLARRGREAAMIVMGCVLLFFVAGLIESFIRQGVDDTDLRYAIAAASGVGWLLYLVLAGKEKRRG